MSHAIDSFLALPVWQTTPLERVVPLAESARVERCVADQVLFRQFYPADRISLLVSGAVAHETSEDIDSDAWPMGHVDWPWAVLGWSSFLPPHRNGTTARTLSEAELLTWRVDALSQLFYADPLLSISFLRLVLDSMRRQFEWLRTERLASSARQPALTPHHDLTRPHRHRFAPGLLTTLRRSAFFQQFDDSALIRLTEQARLVRRGPNQQVLRQNQPMDGLWVLASGRAVSSFEASFRDGDRLLPFRTISGDGGAVAGLPTLEGGYVAEASVLTESVCCFYEIPGSALESIGAQDPEFGRNFMQRHIARLAHLMTSARLPRPAANQEPEVAAVNSILSHNQARIPVNSDLYKLPHLLSHRLTAGNAFACLNTVAETGRYQERAIARSCRDLLSGWYREHHFYRDVLEAYMDVVDAAPEVRPEELRVRCDERLGQAFRHLDTEIHNIRNLPKSPGNVVIMNHLACPEYYQLPNNYHFSFDTAFVSVLLTARYGRPPVRVVRQSPGGEFGHNLFYSRLGHITVPTIESGIEHASNEEMDRLRRRAGEVLFELGGAALQQGEDVLICPEGQSQKAADSPARFYSGAFRLALRTRPEPLIVPIAIAGFERRYKDSRLVAMVEEPFRLSERMRELGTDNLREFLDIYQPQFRQAVIAARQMSNGHEAASFNSCAATTAARPAESPAPLRQ